MDDTTTTTVTGSVDGLDVSIDVTTPNFATDSFEIDVGIETTEIADDVNVAIVLDTSGSTFRSSGSDVDGDGATDTFLEAQVSAAKELFQSLIDAGYDTDDVSVTLIEYNTNASTIGTFSLEELTEFEVALDTLNSGGQTNYESALDEVLTEWSDTSTDANPDNDVEADDSNFVFFLSDGRPFVGSTTQPNSAFADEALALGEDFNATVVGIGVGANASSNALDVVDNTSGGSTTVTDVSQIADVITAPAEGASFEELRVFVDGVLVETISVDDPRITTDVSGFTGLDLEVSGYAFEIGTDINVEVRAVFDDGSDVITVSSITIPVTPCFVDGTHILTPQGLRKIEELDVGDMVITRDRQAQPIRWIGASVISPSFLQSNPVLCPILIKANALGDQLPRVDLRVSRQHRFLISDWRAEMMFGQAEVLAAAHSLVNDKTIIQDHPKEAFSYFHMVFDHHEIVFAEGVETESFHPTKMIVDAMAPSQRAELFALFPQLENMNFEESAYEAARPQLKHHEVKLFL